MSGTYIDRDPFANERDAVHVKAALRDIVTVRDSNGVHTSSGMDAYGADDIIGSYSTDSQQDPPQRQQQHQQSSANAERPTVGRSQSSNGHKERERTSSKKKSDMPLDVIDRLDISGLYGGGSLQRHDGPYAAATASRNQGPRAPMAAFDPAALAPPGAVPSRPSAAPRKSSKNLSARAQATLAAMDDYDGAGRDGPYGGAAKPGQQSRRRGSDPLVTMGYPDRKAGKGAQLIEMYGVRDVEAWEDYGRRDYKGGDHSGTSSRESIVPTGVSKEDRMERAQSIWDIEATLAAGKPVGQAPPPPMPVFPVDLGSSSGYEANGNASSNKPKRSKSLAARLRGGGRKSNSAADATGEPLPLTERGQDDQSQTSPVRAQAHQYSPLQLDTVGQEHNAASADELQRQQYRQGAPPISPVERFKGGEGFGFPGTRSLSHDSANGPGSGSSFSSSPSSASAMDSQPGMARRPSVMQRLFSSKRKDKEPKA